VSDHVGHFAQLAVRIQDLVSKNFNHHPATRETSFGSLLLFIRCLLDFKVVHSVFCLKALDRLNRRLGRRNWLLLICERIWAGDSENYCSENDLADALIEHDVPYFFSTGSSVTNIKDGYRDQDVLKKPFTFDQLSNMFSRSLHHQNIVVKLRH
jgi:hypothetical protein